MDPAAPAAEPLFLAGYPPWLVALVAGLLLLLACWLFAKAFRILAALLAIAVIGIASWVAWEYIVG